MKLTCIMRDPEAGDSVVEIPGPRALGQFLAQVVADLNTYEESDSHFTITFEKKEPECLIQTLN